MAFNNSFDLAQKYLSILDEIYMREAITAGMDSRNVEFTGANTIKVFKIDMDGLGDYKRNEGFVDGAVTGTWEEKVLTQDRGRGFQIDRMDNEETLGQAFGALAGEFMRTKVIPEVDAYTFAKLAGTEGILTGTADVASGSTNIADLIDKAQYEMDEAEVPTEGRMLFMSNAAYAALKPNITRGLGNETTVNREIETFNDMVIRRVPQVRFNTGIEQLDGESGGQEAGGYKPADGSYKINFMIVHPSSIVKAVKHVIPRIFSPDVNQKADAWLFQYRAYWDVFTYDNKVKGIYLHRGTTAN